MSTLSCPILLIFFTSHLCHAQDDRKDSLNIGDKAPPLRVSQWVKGTPIGRFEKGKIYVLDFWATWCRPCVVSMPESSDLSRKYKSEVSFIAVDVYESKQTTAERVRNFVDSMGEKMDFYVALEDTLYTVSDWLEAFGERGRTGIPRVFVVNRDGLVVWIGYPMDLDKVLSKVVRGTWNIEEARAERDLFHYLKFLDSEVYFDLLSYMPKVLDSTDLGKPDSSLAVINRLLKKERRMKYAPAVAYHTFASLLLKDASKAYDYGKTAMATRTYQEPAFDNIIGAIDFYSARMTLPDSIYLLGAQACQMRIDYIPYPELVNMAAIYKKMAGFYCRGKAKFKAIAAQQVAVCLLKKRKNYCLVDLANYEMQLQQYINTD